MNQPRTLDELESDLRFRLGSIVQSHPDAILMTSFGAEDMVLFDAIATQFRSLAVATLDTGRLPEATYDLWRRATERYRKKVEAFFPLAASVETYIRINGVNGFYDSVAQRKDCCHVRKVEPLARALAGRSAWLTGQRRAQAQSRGHLQHVETDAIHGIEKFNPLADWTEAETWAYLRARDVPYNALHDAGYPSIGCAPCTRAIQPGEDVRAGRWWWEDASSKECGLHVKKEELAA